jgi:hypothetical protein
MLYTSHSNRLRPEYQQDDVIPSSNLLRLSVSIPSLLRSTVAFRTPKDLLAQIWSAEPGDVPCRLSVLDTALGVPAAPDRLVPLLVLVVQVISKRLAAVHTVETHAIEVSQCVGNRLEDNALPVDATAAITLWSVRVVKGLETTHNLADTGVVESVINWPSITFGEGKLVATDRSIPART